MTDGSQQFAENSTDPSQAAAVPAEAGLPPAEGIASGHAVEMAHGAEVPASSDVHEELPIEPEPVEEEDEGKEVTR